MDGAATSAGIAQAPGARPARTSVAGSPRNVGLAPGRSWILLRINQSLFCKRLTLKSPLAQLRLRFPPLRDSAQGGDRLQVKS